MANGSNHWEAGFNGGPDQPRGLEKSSIRRLCKFQQSSGLFRFCNAVQCFWEKECQQFSVVELVQDEENEWSEASKPLLCHILSVPAHQHFGICGHQPFSPQEETNGTQGWTRRRLSRFWKESHSQSFQVLSCSSQVLSRRIAWYILLLSLVRWFIVSWMFLDSYASRDSDSRWVKTCCFPFEDIDTKFFLANVGNCMDHVTSLVQRLSFFFSVAFHASRPFCWTSLLYECSRLRPRYSH